MGGLVRMGALAWVLVGASSRGGGLVWFGGAFLGAGEVVVSEVLR